VSQFGGDDFKLHADLSVSLGDSLKALEGFENKIAQTAEATQAAIGKISASLNALNRRAKFADPAGAREAGNAAAKLAPELLHAAQQANALERSFASLFATSARATPALTAISGSMASISASSAQAATQSTTAIRLIGSAAAVSAGPVKALADGQKQLSEKTATAVIEASRLRLANLAAAVSAETSQLATRKVVDALDRAAAYSTRAAEGLRQFGSRLSLVGTLVSAGFATASFREFEHLDEALVALRSTLGQTEKEFASIRIAVVDLAQGTEFSATKVADSVRRFVAAQNSLPDSLRLTEVAARGAVASQTDLVTSTEALSTALRSFRIPADEAERTMAQLSIASEQSRVGFAQFSQALSAVAPAAASAGGDLAGTLAVLRDMIQETGDASEATTKFRSVLQELIGVDPLSKQGERLREVLGSTVEASFATRGLVETIKLIVNAAEGSTTKLQELVGAGRTLVAFTRLQRLGVDELDKSYKRFSEITAANLTEEYRTQKDAVSELVKETKALINIVFLHKEILSKSYQIIKGSTQNKISFFCFQLNHFYILDIVLSGVFYVAFQFARCNISMIAYGVVVFFHYASFILDKSAVTISPSSLSSITLSSITSSSLYCFFLNTTISPASNCFASTTSCNSSASMVSASSGVLASTKFVNQSIVSPSITPTCTSELSFFGSTI
jgi:TP901 family phage tail tape measure protein